MVTLPQVSASNAQIPSSLPKDLVAVFVGATNGIGETTLREFARFTKGLAPKVFFVGRVQEAGERIARECKALNADGEFTFIKADVGLLKGVDEVCEKVKGSVGSGGVNLLWLSQGTLQTGVDTEEGLHLPSAVAMYGRQRFLVNLLPLLQKATGLRRVVSCFVGTKEGPIDMNNIQGRGLGPSKMIAFRGHGASMTTLSMEHLAKQYPTVSFIHDFPGPVKSGIGRGPGWALLIMRSLASIVGPMFNIPLEESGQRHVYLCTSARYPAKVDEKASAVPLGGEILIAKGTDGLVGSGVYTVDEHCESGDEKVDALLAGLRKDGLTEKVWQNAEDEFVRITGRAKI
ncbi:hypothetical protein M409DRAFT_36751 [Zasmidium cellare ATCC 36951]|uniref:Ketoreductase (KR) domain-containing protein n=1 Tax=Zasmidium cellare ATCC 36951 TaxID=1080233 RepID=A0A6A6CID4_ZASCE|nr:uncharacterized protein M409DRAFT_36751 [Zasmidium cellare ATCC 36951]KAF2166363.1 hypothetical protein M409DRAFT_36751 [Zasmidium cellare ATCC 36951]